MSNEFWLVAVDWRIGIIGASFAERCSADPVLERV
jgi:hypothetical protein